MLSIAQHEANQANAALSTGPRAETGKAASSQNARKHGLSAAQLVVLPDEKPIFDELVAASNAGFDPQTEIEKSLVDQIIRASWNMRRAGTLEAKLAAQTADPLENPEHADTLSRYRRHTLDAERSFYRALAELRKVQAARASHTPEMPPEEAPPLGPSPFQSEIDPLDGCSRPRPRSKKSR